MEKRTIQLDNMRKTFWICHQSNSKSTFKTTTYHKNQKRSEESHYKRQAYLEQKENKNKRLKLT